MEKSIQKHEPMMQVTCKDGRIFFFPRSKFDDFKKALNELLFIPIEGVGVNKYEIKYYEDMPKDYDLLVGLPEDVRNECLKEFKRYETNLGERPPREVRMKKIEKILKKYSDEK